MSTVNHRNPQKGSPKKSKPQHLSMVSRL